MRWAVAVTVALLLATPAHATRKFVTGFEFCTFDTTNQFLFDSVSGTPTMMTTGARVNFCEPGFDDRGKDCTVDTDCEGTCWNEPNNNCYLQLDSGDQVKLGSTYFAAGSTLFNHLLIRVDTVGTVNSDVILIKESANDGAFLRAVAGSVSGTYRFDLYYRDTNTECNGGTNDGTECTACRTDSDCTSGTCVNGSPLPDPTLGACTDECTADTIGEQWCIDSAIGSTPTLTVGRWYEIVIGQDNTVGTASQTSLELWEGGFQRGLRTRTETTNPGNVTDIVVDVPSGSGWVLSLDDDIVDDAVTTGMTMVRISDLSPSSDISTGLGTNSGSVHFDRVNQSTPDGETTYLNKGTGTPNNDRLGMTDVALATGESITSGEAMAFSMVVKDHGDASAGSQKYLRFCAHDGTNEACQVNTCTTNADCQASPGNDWECNSGECYIDASDQVATYVPSAYSMVSDPPGADTAWTTTNVNAMQGYIQYDTITASKAFRITKVTAELPITMPAPAKPGIAVDVNGDGVNTFCLTGDSTVNNQIHATLVADLVDFDNMIFCTRGSKTEGDIELQIHDIMDGKTGGTMNCTVKKGSAAPCDYLVVAAGINTLVGGAPTAQSYCNGGTNHGKCCGTNCTNPTSVTCTGGTCQYYVTGYCRGGTDHGNPCSCPQNNSWKTTNGAVYCANNKTSGAVWLSSSTTTCNTCSTNADCATNIACASNADCQLGSCDTGISECIGTCSGSSRCLFSSDTEAYVRADRVGVSSTNWKMPGCTGVDNCSGGLCVAGNTVAEYERSLRVILDAADNRACSGGTCDGNGNVSCTVDTDCAVEIVLAPQPHSIAKNTVFWGAFTAHTQDGEAIATMQTDIAKAESRHLIDLNAAFEAKCADVCGSIDACHGDAIHWSACGIGLAADTIVDGFTNNGGTSDGVCTTNVCTAGKVGDACTANANCDIWDCAF